jgi:hypothetical protein
MDGGKARRTGITRGEPVEDLDELQLVIQVVLEPKDYFLMITETGEGGIPELEICECLIERQQALAGKVLSPDAAELLMGETGGDRAVMENVIPGDCVPRDTCGAEGTGNGFAVGNVKHYYTIEAFFSILSPAATI